MKLKTTIGLALLAAQLVMMTVARFHPMRYYSWAPFDALHAYTIHASLDGQPLSSEQIYRRYHLTAEGFNPRAIFQVTDTIAYVERVYHTAQQADVTVTYTLNGREQHPWQWPNH